MEQCLVQKLAGASQGNGVEVPKGASTSRSSVPEVTKTAFSTDDQVRIVGDTQDHTISTTFECISIRPEEKNYQISKLKSG